LSGRIAVKRSQSNERVLKAIIRTKVVAPRLILLVAADCCSG